MSFSFDLNDPASILAEIRFRSRRLERVIRYDLPALLGRRTLSGLARVADTAGRGELHIRGYARDMLPVLIDACTLAIEDGTHIVGEWVEVGWTDGGVDWAWKERTVYTPEARELLPLRETLRAVIDLLDRIDDLTAAQRDVAVLRL